MNTHQQNQPALNRAHHFSFDDHRRRRNPLQNNSHSSTPPKPPFSFSNSGASPNNSSAHPDSAPKIPPDQRGNQPCPDSNDVRSLQYLPAASAHPNPTM